MNLRPIKHRELIAKLTKLNWSGPFGGGKHLYFVLGARKIYIPNPHGGDMPVGVLKDIIKRIGVTVEEFMNL